MGCAYSSENLTNGIYEIKLTPLSNFTEHFYIGLIRDEIKD